MARLVSVHPAASNWVFAAVQILIGIGLFRRDTVRPALALSFFWALGVWCFGEGFGMLLTGTASPLSGAPGAVILYAVIGILIWPRHADAYDPTQTRSATSVGPWRERGGRIAWAAIWLGMATLWLFPANDGPNGTGSVLEGAAGSSPEWLAHLQVSLAVALRGDGLAVAIVLAVLSAVIGIGPIMTRHATVFLIIGAALSIDYWVLGQSFVGLVTGIATDPNAGPLMVLFALALFPNRAPAPAAFVSGPVDRSGAPNDPVGDRQRILTPA